MNTDFQRVERTAVLWHGRPARVFLVRHTRLSLQYTGETPVPLLFGCGSAAPCPSVVNPLVVNEN